MQIPISVAQGWLSGGDSAGARVDRSKPPGKVLLRSEHPNLNLIWARGWNRNWNLPDDFAGEFLS